MGDGLGKRLASSQGESAADERDRALNRSALHDQDKTKEKAPSNAPRIGLALVGSLLGTLLIAGPFIYQALT